MTRGSFQLTIGMNQSTDKMQRNSFNVNTKAVGMTRDVGGYRFMILQTECGLYTLQGNQGLVPTQFFVTDIDPR